MRRLFFGCFLLFGTIFVLMAAPTVRGEVYRWIDENGVTQFTDDLAKVPAKQRQKAETDSSKPPKGNLMILETTPPKKTTGESLQSPFGGAPQPTPPEQGKDYWQKRLRDTQEKIAQTKTELDEVLVAKRENFGVKLGPGIQQRQAELAEKEAQLKSRLQGLEKELNETIPEDARKAGAPPGWLRQ